MNRKPATCFNVNCLTLLALAVLLGLAADVASFAGTSAGLSVTVGWDLSTNSDVTNYNVYYGAASGVYTNEIAFGNTNLATVTGLLAGTNYYFAVTSEDTNGMESAFSNEAEYVIPISAALPFIATQPANQTVLSGGEATFSVTVGGAPPFSYQWSFNGTILSGATDASLTLTNVSSAQEGNYTVLVGNSYGSILSSNAMFVLAGPPFIAMQPASQSVESGCSAVISVAASGTAPLSYQWFYNGVVLASQTNSSVSMTGVETSQFGNYSVVVNNPFGVATSSVAVLALASPPTTSPCTVQRFQQGGLRLNVSVLTSKDTVALYDSLTVIAVGSNSTAGGTVTLNTPWIYYAPPAGAASIDSFTYTVSDGHCGTASGVVVVMPDAISPQPLHFDIAQMGDGSLQLSFDGVPGGTYQLQASESLSSPNWQALTNQAADDFGVFQYTDWPLTNAQMRFYRALWP